MKNNSTSKKLEKLPFRYSGFTLIELLIVIVIISALATVVLVALNPVNRLQAARNARRTSDTDSIRTAINEFIVDKETLPGIPNDGVERQIGTGAGLASCTIATSVCNVSATNCVDLTTPLAPYLKTIPLDPKTGSPSATGYTVSIDVNDNITVQACETEGLPGNPTPIPPASFDVIADFGNRINTSYPIPVNFLGVGGLGMNGVLPQMDNYLPLANFHVTRLGDFAFATIFPNYQSVTDDTQRSWAAVDQDFNQVITAHSAGATLQPIVVLSYTTAWAESYSDATCKDATHVRPSYIQGSTDIGYQVWGQMAAAVIHHVAVKYMKTNPWLQPMYEIWNEPNGTGYMCEPSTMSSTLADQTRLTTWLSLYDAAAPLMRTQAQADGVTIKIGGPAHSYPLQQQLTLWFPAFVTGTYVNSTTGANFNNDTNITNNIDFVSYHHYTSGSTLNGGTGSMVSNAQDTAKGIEAIYDGVANIVHTQGTYPGHQTTPIYIDEYNSNPCTGATNPCRNDSVMAPLTNGLYVIDFLNTVFDSAPTNGPASVLPGGMSYFTWSIPNGGYCMFGNNDITNAPYNLDCITKNGPLQPYPQYYAYQLIGSSNYLNIEGNSYDATSVTSNNAGVFAAAFYNGTTENIMIDNMNTIDYPAFAVRLQNPGTVSNLTAKFSTVSYNTSAPDSSITATQVPIVPINGDYYAIVHLPQLTLAGLSVTF